MTTSQSLRLCAPLLVLAVAAGHAIGAPDSPSKKPQVRMGDLAVLSETRTERTVGQKMTENLDRMLACYRARLADKPDLEGRVLARFRITNAGIIDQAAALGLDDQVADCVETQLKAIKMPPIKDDEPASVRLSFTFSTKAD